MSRQSWQEALMVMEVDGPQLVSSTTATSILTPAAKLTLPANFFDIGKKLKIRAQGRVSNVIATPGTITFDFRLGGTVVWNGGAIQMSTTAHTNIPWWLEVDVTCRVIGSSANLMGQGNGTSRAFSISGADATSGDSSVLLPDTAPAVGSNFDSTASLQADLFATFSVNGATTNLTCHQYEIISAN